MVQVGSRARRAKKTRATSPSAPTRSSTRRSRWCVADARDDPRFADNPLVLGDPNIRFYAGQPVAAPGGEAVGTLCVFDDKPRDVADFDTEVLGELAAMVEAEIASLSLAIGDELTGLSNRRGFEMLGERLLAAAAASTCRSRRSTPTSTT